MEIPLSIRKIAYRINKRAIRHTLDYQEDIQLMVRWKIPLPPTYGRPSVVTEKSIQQFTGRHLKDPPPDRFGRSDR